MPEFKSPIPVWFWGKPLNCSMSVFSSVEREDYNKRLFHDDLERIKSFNSFKTHSAWHMVSNWIYIQFFSWVALRVPLKITWFVWHFVNWNLCREPWMVDSPTEPLISMQYWINSVSSSLENTRCLVSQAEESPLCEVFINYNNAWVFLLI